MMRVFLFSFMLFTTFLTLTAQILAQTASSEALIEKRVTLIKSVARKTSLLTKMSRNEVPFELQKAREVVVFARKAVAEFMTLFPEGSEKGGKTRASPRIWSDRVGFNQHGKRFADAADVFLKDVVDEKTFRAATSKIFAPCKNCHDDYRMPK